MPQKIYNIYYHKKKDREIAGIKQIKAYTLLQAKFLFSKLYNLGREYIIDDVRVY